MTPRCYVVGGPSDPVIVSAFAQGCKGEIVDMRGQPASAVFVQGRPAVVWGLLRGSTGIISLAQATGTPWVYIDHGYFKRGHYDGYYRCTLGNFQLNRILALNDDERWNQLGIELHPWRTGGADIIVCPPSGVVAETFGKQNWLASTLRDLNQRTKRRVIVRHKRESSSVPLSQAIRSAHAVVTYNSIAAVEAAVLGVPVLVHGRSAAAPVGATDLSLIENPPRPDRIEWVNSLAYAQFTLAEMRSGLAWAAILGLQLQGTAAPVAAHDHGGAPQHGGAG